jgi:hypothetical protein
MEEPGDPRFLVPHSTVFHAASATIEVIADPAARLISRLFGLQRTGGLT